MAFEYGPGQAGKPQCFGNERYHNPNTRECRACYYQSSCRDQVVRARNYGPISQPPTPGYAAPVYSQVPTVVPVHVTPPVQQARQPPPVPQQSIFPVPPQYGFGWLTDPMYYTMAASPPPMIPQLEGESFLERLGKNMLIGAMQSLTWNLHLAARQFIWPTTPPVKDVNPPSP